MQHQLLVIGLDGFDIGYGTKLMADGGLPALAALRDRSKRFLLDHGAAARTGLAWEHFASAMTPERSRRGSMLELDPKKYEIVQRGTRFAPFYRFLDARIVVFDPPYTDLERAPEVRGIVSWGAHDPGVFPRSSPPELRHELDARFGPYPARSWTYISPWPSARQTAEMGTALVGGVRARREAARWLLTDRCSDWDLAIVVAGEPHSAAEAFWHGIDSDHPLHGHASAAPAAQGIADVYRESDRLVGEIIAATEPRSVLVFSMGGMGPNNADTSSMALLPELMYRWATGNTLLKVPPEWVNDPKGIPPVPEGDAWEQVMSACYPSWTSAKPPRLARRVARRMPASLRRQAVKIVRGADARVAAFSLDWMPAARYRASWPTMRAFALPSFYDGRIRINLRGREAAGLVEHSEYAPTCDEIEEVLRACSDPRTGERAVKSIDRPGAADPFALGSSHADLIVEWGVPACALHHPDLGLIGPAPFRRSGGHTGPFGFAYVCGDGIETGDGGIRSAFDVSPTIAMMLNTTWPQDYDGTSLLAERPVSLST